MTQVSSRSPSIIVRPRGPFDLRLSLQAAASFFPAVAPPPVILRTPVEFDGVAAIVEIRQSAASGVLHASATPALGSDRLRAIVKWLVSADLDLRPFYALVTSHPIVGGVVLSLSGLKPLRPSTLFEMAVIAITEQQLSLAAAFHIRSRLVRRFGAPLGDLRAFPSAEKLARARLRDLAACGLSRRKAEYVKGLAKRVAEGALDLEMLQYEDEQRIWDVLVNNRGLGEWSVKYILSRGFGRPDSLPSGDTGLRRVVGHYLTSGKRLSAAELEQALAPFRPYRGLAAFYLAVHWRLRRCVKPRTIE
jgi:DNA-3-methyladenine glycosylase II